VDQGTTGGASSLLGSWDDPAVSAGWKCFVLSPSPDPQDWSRGGILLEQLDDAGTRWSGSGPSGERIGDLVDVLAAVAEVNADQPWLDIVAAVLMADRDGNRRSGLVARQAHGVWFHATFVENRASILSHGLDWRRFVDSGVAGSRTPETDGIFLCPDDESAEFFAQMGRRHGREVDVWAVVLDGQWLISDPSSSGGLDDGWMICPDPIPANARPPRARPPSVIPRSAQVGVAERRRTWPLTGACRRPLRVLGADQSGRFLRRSSGD
jgi:hypothetical protein